MALLCKREGRAKPQGVLGVAERRLGSQQSGTRQRAPGRQTRWRPQADTENRKTGKWEWPLPRALSRGAVEPEAHSASGSAWQPCLFTFSPARSAGHLPYAIGVYLWDPTGDLIGQRVEKGSQEAGPEFGGWGGKDGEKVEVE